jgi:prepilin-type N-terminal cleavage/methylation domain-containing protein
MTDMTRRRSGFTVIEVMIVLAIAGVILLIVFLAVPALQRTHRNYNRRLAAQYAQAQIEDYFAQNGRYPYLGAGPALDLRANFVDGLKNEGPTMLYSFRFTDESASHEYPFSGSGVPADPDMSLDEITIMPGHMCNRAPGLGPGDTDYPVKTSIGGDNDFSRYAIWTLLEGTGVYCVDNQN